MRGGLLRVARERRGFGLRELAPSVDVSPGALSMIEKGHRDPSLRTLVRLATVLRIAITIHPGGTIDITRRKQ
jgi:transcriptional regulator with XRE-family HTH domain